tara:strand:+ start:49 stop:567 length:519 start_codon:yes stop_codon:yes gene_type:complete
MQKLTNGISYTLNKEDASIIAEMLKNLENEDDNGYFDNNFKIDKNMKLKNMVYNGFGAELAFCRLCDIAFDNSVQTYKNYFLQDDAVLKNGKRIDVKSTIYKYGKLAISPNKSKHIVDGYALMVGEFPSFTFKGWASYNEIINPDNIGTLGNHNVKSYILNQHQLNKELIIE